MIISCIVAMAQNRVIGKDNQIPWHLPADLKYFKKITSGHHLIMGRNCYESIGRPLPNRRNIILSKSYSYSGMGLLHALHVHQALQIAYQNGETEAFIIGGGQVYASTQGLWDRIYLTEVEAVIEGDVFFPALDMALWDLKSEKCMLADDKNKIPYSFKIYDRKTHCTRTSR